MAVDSHIEDIDSCIGKLIQEEAYNKANNSEDWIPESSGAHTDGPVTFLHFPQLGGIDI